ncbi:MAG: hypothetical protein FJX35_03980 [Alphaproteobacteria bacterium]|nr:hypothetical protein [Alphaproteobacteria bacterium]
MAGPLLCTVVAWRRNHSASAIGSALTLKTSVPCSRPSKLARLGWTKGAAARAIASRRSSSAVSSRMTANMYASGVPGSAPNGGPASDPTAVERNRGA